MKMDEERVYTPRFAAGDFPSLETGDYVKNENDEYPVAEKIRFAFNTVYFAMDEVKFMAGKSVEVIASIAGAIIKVAQIAKTIEAGVQVDKPLELADLQDIADGKK